MSLDNLDRFFGLDLRLADAAKPPQNLYAQHSRLTKHLSRELQIKLPKTIQELLAAQVILVRQDSNQKKAGLQLSACFYVSSRNLGEYPKA